MLFTCASSTDLVLNIVTDLGRIRLSGVWIFLWSGGVCPDDVISGNGSNLITTATHNHSSQHNIEWYFGIRLALWYGVFLEWLVRAIKGHSEKQLKSSRLAYEETLMLMYEIILILNNSSIINVYPNDLEDCLTPNHLIFSRRLKSRSLVNHTSSNILSSLLPFHWSKITCVHCNRKLVLSQY